MLCEVKHWLRTEELRAHFRVIAGFVLLGLELVTRFFMASWRKQGHPLAEHLHLLAVHAMNVHRLLLRHPCPACSRAAVFCSTILASAEYMLNPELLQATLASVIQWSWLIAVSSSLRRRSTGYPVQRLGTVYPALMRPLRSTCARGSLDDTSTSPAQLCNVASQACTPVASHHIPWAARPRFSSPDALVADPQP